MKNAKYSFGLQPARINPRPEPIEHPARDPMGPKVLGTIKGGFESFGPTPGQTRGTTGDESVDSSGKSLFSELKCM